MQDYICWDKYLELNRVVSAQVLLASAQYVSLDFLASKQVLPEQVISKLVQYTKQQIEICESYNMLEEQWYIFKHQLIRFWTCIMFLLGFFFICVLSSCFFISSRLQKFGSKHVNRVY